MSTDWYPNSGYPYPPDRPETVQGLIDHLGRLKAEFDDAVKGVDKARGVVADKWEGQAAYAGDTRLVRLRREASQAADLVEAAVAALKQYAGTLEWVRGEVAAVGQTLVGARFSMGKVVYADPSPSAVVEADRRYVHAIAVLNEALTDVRGALNRATPLVGLRRLWPELQVSVADGRVLTIDTDPAVQLAAFAGGQIAPEDIATWWQRLTSSQRQDLIRGYYRRLGGLDGIPMNVREGCNRRSLDEDLAAAIATIEELDGVPPDRLGLSNARLAKAIAIKAAAEKVLEQLTPPTKEDPERHLLVWDPNGGTPLAALAIGDVTTATNVMVQACGMGTTVEKDLKEWMDRLGPIEHGAQQLAEDFQSPDSAPAMAVVAWLGYDPPDYDSFGSSVADGVTELVAVTNPGRAAAGATVFNSFMRGLVAGRDVPPEQLVVSAHSYGSTMAALAIQQGGIPVDDFVVEGSPGVGSGVFPPGVGCWALAAPDDPIPKITHPPDPGPLGWVTPPIMALYHAANGALGANAFDVFTRLSTTGGPNPSDPTEMLIDAYGHLGLWKKGTMSAFQQMALLAGQRQLLVEAE